MTRRRHNSEGGYALLFIFAMAAIVAVMLYKEMPRVAFEAQRDREQLLIDRGQEYSRAIALYVRKFNRFPGSMDDLNNTNNQRFLRRQFVDPMTGKADWRLLHAGPGGVITDSINNKPQQTNNSISTPTNMTVMSMLGVTQPGSQDGSGGVNLATRQRPSGPGSGAGMGPGGTNINDPNSGDNNAAASNPTGNGTGIPGYNGPVMVTPDGRIVPATATGVPVAVGASGATGASGGVLPGFGIPGTPGMPPQIATQPPNLPNGVAVQTNSNVPNPTQVNQPPGAAASLINSILTTPRPGGMNGIGGMATSAGPISAAPGAAGSTPSAFGSTTTPPGQQVIGAGLAGVASKREQEGIKTYNDKTKYNEWEFVYDITKDPSRTGQSAQTGAQGASGATGNQNQTNGPGQSGQSPFGQSSAFGNSSAFGSGNSAPTTPTTTTTPQ